MKNEAGAYRQFLDGINAADRPLTVNQDLFSIVVDEAVPYLAGQTTAEQAARAVCDKIGQYRTDSREEL